MPIKPTKVLCKRTLTNGDTFWWDDSVVPPVRHEHDNRMLVAGDWYDVIENENDSWDEEKRSFTFTILDNQKKRHLFFMYDEEDKANWPDICTKYGPRDYAKWFYTPEELELLAQGKFKLEEDINIRPGNYHWVLTNDDEWIIAQCYKKHAAPGKFYWNIIGTDLVRTCFNFKEIGQQVQTQEQQQKEKTRLEAHEELFGEITVLVDAINKPDPDENYPSVEYVMPFVNKAMDRYFDKSWSTLADIFDK